MVTVVNFTPAEHQYLAQSNTGSAASWSCKLGCWPSNTTFLFDYAPFSAQKPAVQPRQGRSRLMFWAEWRESSGVWTHIKADRICDSVVTESVGHVGDRNIRCVLSEGFYLWTSWVWPREAMVVKNVLLIVNWCPFRFSSMLIFAGFVRCLAASLTSPPVALCALFTTFSCASF